MEDLFSQKILLVFNQRRKTLSRLFMLPFLLISFYAYSQNTSLITGRVTDAGRVPLQGVSVIVKGRTVGVSSNGAGSFEINASPNSTLMFSFVGFETKEIKVNGRTKIDLVLETAASSLDQVVVVGYGTQKKSTLTGSVSSLKGKEVAETPVANISNSIAGKMAGVSMRPNGGQPGRDNPDIHIRGIGTTGNNAPLIVVDGIIRSNINQIDPNSIESISVMKDAAAVAPYGLGGANGVILITTKRGKTGAPSLSLNSYYGTQSPTYNYYPKLLRAKDYMLLKNEAYLNDNLGVVPTGGQLPFDQAIINDYANLHAKDPNRYPESNPAEYVTNWRAPIQQYDLQVSGGSDKIRYYAGLGFFKQNGVFAPMNYNRYNYNMNLETNVTSSTKVSLSVIGSIEKTNDVDPNEGASGLFRSGYKFIPTQSIFYSNGLWGEFAGRSPVAVLRSGGYVHNNNNTLLTSISIDQQLRFVKGLSAKVVFAYDPNQRTIKSWHRPYYFYAQNLNTTPYSYVKQISANEGGAPNYTWLREEYQKNQNFTFQGFLNYHNTFGKSDITGLFVAEARKNQYEMFNASRNI
jgi:TonB-linked SusC/RagA family outer membrane protein